MKHRRTWFLSLTPLFISATMLTNRLSAEVVRVPDEFPTIGGALASLWIPGDTVLVAPGTYSESLEIPVGVTLLSEGGAELTVLRHDTRVISCLGSLVTPFRLIGFTVRDATDTALLCGSDTREDVELRSCRFVGNAGHKGGAVLIAYASEVPSTVQIRECVFENNRAVDWGGALSLSGIQTGVIENNLFLRNSALKGAGIGTRAMNKEGNPPPLIIRNNRFIENDVLGEGGAVAIIGSDFHEISGNAFYDNRAGMHGGALAVFSNSEHIDVHGNLVVGSKAGDLGGGIALLDCKATVFRNTVDGSAGVRGGGVAVFGPATEVSLSNNVVTNSVMGSGIWRHGNVFELITRCNDSWGNAGGDFEGLVPSSDDFSLNPQYCDPDQENYDLAQTSPCAPGNSPAGCGLIGAFPIGCGVADVATETAPSADPGLIVIPNPVRGVARFELDSSNPSTTLTIFDSVGRIVEQLTREQDHWQWIPGSAVPAGVYFARLETATGTATPVKFLFLR